MSTKAAEQSRVDKTVTRIVARLSQIQVLHAKIDPRAGLGYEISFPEGKVMETRLFSAIAVFRSHPINGGVYFDAAQLMSQADHFRARELVRHFVRFHERVPFGEMTIDESLDLVMIAAVPLLPALDEQLRAARRRLVLEVVAAVGDDVDLADIETAWRQSQVDRVHGT